MIRLLIACLAALFFSSCLDSHEEVWLNADASGKARVNISLPIQAAYIHGGEDGVKSMVTEYLETSPAFTTYSVVTSTTKDQLKIELSVTFENALDLTHTTHTAAFDELPEPAKDLLGHTQVGLQGADLTFHRKLDLTRTILGSVLIPKEQLKGQNLTTIIHLPKAASSQNAHTVADSGKTLTWITPIERAFREPINQTFTMPLPIPWLIIVAIALAVLFLFGAAFYYIYRRKKMKVAC